MSTILTQSGSNRPLAQGDTASAEFIRARVKWYNAAKGFGFVAPVDGTADAFLHASALQRAGFPTIAEGSEVLCEVIRGPKGPQVLRVLEVTEPSEQELQELEGEVKWYQPEKGFGFVLADDGGRDIFIHKSVLRRCQLEGLEQGARVRVQVSNTPKGREAVSVELV